MKTSSDPLSLIFLALAHPVRRNMIERLRKGKASVNDLKKGSDIKGPMMTKHLKILEDAELIKREQVSQQILSELNAKTLQKVDDWVEKYKNLWLGKINRLEELYELEQHEKES